MPAATTRQGLRGHDGGRLDELSMGNLLGNLLGASMGNLLGPLVGGKDETPRLGQ